MYTVELLGFTDGEKISFGNIFKLSTKRNPSFFKNENPNQLADIYIVDGRNIQFLEQYKQIFLRSRNVPAIFLYEDTVLAAIDSFTELQHLPNNLPKIKFPIVWTKIIMALDMAIKWKFDVQSQGLNPMNMGPTHGNNDGAAKIINKGVDRATTNSGESRGVVPLLDRAVGSNNAGSAMGGFRNALVVDDSPHAREFLQSKLVPKGFIVEFAEDGEEAIAKCSRKKWDIVFLDVVMPNINGYQVCKILKSNASVSGEHITVIMLTSKSSPFDKLRGTMAGCDAYLTKPIEDSDLDEMIDKFIVNKDKYIDKKQK